MFVFLHSNLYSKFLLLKGVTEADCLLEYIHSRKGDVLIELLPLKAYPLKLMYALKQNSELSVHSHNAISRQITFYLYILRKLMILKSTLEECNKLNFVWNRKSIILTCDSKQY